MILSVNDYITTSKDGWLSSSSLSWDEVVLWSSFSVQRQWPGAAVFFSSEQRSCGRSDVVFSTDRCLNDMYHNILLNTRHYPLIDDDKESALLSWGWSASKAVPSPASAVPSHSHVDLCREYTMLRWSWIFVFHRAQCKPSNDEMNP